MREIISVHVGQSGIGMGHEFWKHLGEEGILNPLGEPDENHPFHETQIEEFDEKELKKYDYELQIFYKETSHRKKYVPRCLFVDLEDSCIDKVMASEHGRLFDMDSFLASRCGSSNLFAVGYYTDGAYQIRSIMETLRKELEACDCPLAFSVGHSLSGGTGSGLGTLILTRLADEFPDILRISSSIFPSPGMAGDQNLAPFNSLCAFNMLAEFCDQVYLYDNSALNRCLLTYLKMDKPELKDLNRLLAHVQCHITSPMRYPGKLASDLRKMGTNLLPFPRLKFLGLSQSPICFEFDVNHESWSMAGPKKLSQYVLHPDNSLTSIDVESGKFLSSAMIWRGNMFTAEWETLGPDLREKMSEYSVGWIPYNMQMIHARGGPIESNLSCTLIGNHTGIRNIFVQNIQNFNKFFNKGAFVHYYTREGMEKEYFEEARQNLNDLCAEYQSKENIEVDIEDVTFSLSDNTYRNYIASKKKNHSYDYKYRSYSMEFEDEDEERKHEEREQEEEEEEEKDDEDEDEDDDDDDDDDEREDEKTEEEEEEDEEKEEQKRETESETDEEKYPDEQKSSDDEKNQQLTVRNNHLLLNPSKSAPNPNKYVSQNNKSVSIIINPNRTENKPIEKKIIRRVRFADEIDEKGGNGRKKSVDEDEEEDEVEVDDEEEEEEKDEDEDEEEDDDDDDDATDDEQTTEEEDD